MAEPAAPDPGTSVIGQHDTGTAARQKMRERELDIGGAADRKRDVDTAVATALPKQAGQRAHARAVRSTEHDDPDTLIHQREVIAGLEVHQQRDPPARLVES